MDDLIARLQERYDNGHDFSLLTEQQKAFLLAPTIANHKDKSRQKTVSVTNIVSEADGPLLNLSDCFVYYAHDHGPGGPFSYATERIQAYMAILQIAERPQGLKEDYQYLFRLPDSRIRVQFKTYREHD